MTNLLLIILIISILILTFILIRFNDKKAGENKNLQNSFDTYSKLLNENQRNMAEQQNFRLEALEKSIRYMREENDRQIEKVRFTVDEKLQKTLDEKLNNSFSLVSERLEQVFKGLGEMQNIASSVGDLKKILGNVKTRGILGEVQLEAILNQILTSSQFDKEVITKKGTANKVEFAIKLPGDDEGVVYLPIDAKFPGDTYISLLDAYENGDKNVISNAKKKLIARIRQEAQEISGKYIDPPNTTDFAIMFLPVEGLYAEVINLGMLEDLQRTYNVTIAGPTTISAILNSLQMGFRTLAIEKRSSEVWRILSAVKAEFETFGKSLEKAQKKIQDADKSIEELVGTRTRVMNKKLSHVTAVNVSEARQIIDEEEY